MNRKGHAGRTDANQAEVVKALRAIGATVQSLAMVGGGCPDLLIGFRDATILMEIKDGAKCLSRTHFTEAELSWHDKWNGKRVWIAYSAEMAVTQVIDAAEEGS